MDPSSRLAAKPNSPASPRPQAPNLCLGLRHLGLLEHFEAFWAGLVILGIPIW